MTSTKVTSSRGNGYILPRTDFQLLKTEHHVFELSKTRGENPLDSVLSARSAQISSIDNSVCRLLKKSEEEIDLPLRFPSYLVEDFIARYDVTHKKEKFDALACIRHSQPAILLNASFISDLEKLFEFVKKEESCDVHLSKLNISRFYAFDEEKNVFGSGYQIRQPETLRKMMRYDDFIDALQNWNHWSLLLKIDLSNFQITSNAGSSCYSEEWLKTFMVMNNWTRIKTSFFFQGSLNGAIPSHYKTHDSMLFVTSGKLRVLLIGPEYALNGVYPFPKHHPYDGYSMVDFDNVDLHQWPDFDKVRGKYCIFREGEALYIPQYFFAHIHILEQGSSWVDVRLNSKSKLRSPACIDLQVSRYVEDFAAMIDGVHRSRDWLCKIASQTELDSLDLIKAYKKLEIIERLRTEIELNLDKDIKIYLEKLTSRRLLPTTWLNQNFKDPLYLMDKPVIITDKRTEEQRKYPEFFQHAIE